MKLMRRRILQLNRTVDSLDDSLERYFLMADYQLEHLEGDLENVFAAQLTRILKKQNCICSRTPSAAFRKLAGAILYEKPEKPVEPVQEDPSDEKV
ncbi:MAG: hypothetical protein PHV82_11860 [Victivallaceae bacterium]|nr:hypothetical protein [Victivallaceae bacterium]